MGKPIPILGDVPTAQPGLGFGEYAEALADALRGGEPPQFTIGIYGSWGSGKSSLLKAIGGALQGDDSVVTVEFDAWRYEHSGPIVIPLLHRIYKVMEESADPTLTSRLRRILASVANGMSFKPAVFGVEFDLTKVTEHEDRQVAPLDEAFARPFDEMRRLPGELGHRRIVVLVDDLDRCSADNVVALLESINVLMDVPGFIFVLALDYEVLVSAVAARYPYASGHAFIEKIVQVPFRVPRLDLDRSRFLPDLIPGWDRYAAGLPSGFSDVAYDVALLALRANPRQIKRFVNSFLVLHRIMGDEVARDPRMVTGLAAQIGLQLRWPEAYRSYHDAAFASDEPTISGLGDLEEAEADLQKYAQRFFDAPTNRASVRQLLQLTEAVGSEVVQDEAPLSAAESREVNREFFLSRLRELGFHLGRGTVRLYYHDARPDTRYAVEKTHIRFEKKVKGEWRLWESYLLSREVEQALKVMDKPEKHFSNRR